jgi:hypothetical protein
MRRVACWKIVRPAAPCRWVRLTFTLDLMNYMRALTLCLSSLFAVSASYAEGRCQAEEKIYFQCMLGAKVLSVCGIPPKAQESGHLRYVFGPRTRAPEMVFPNQGTPPTTAFRFGEESRSAKGSISNLQFRSGAVTYTVYRFRHAFEGNYAGVAVSRPGATKVYLKCSERDLIDDMFDLREFRLPAMESGEIEEGEQ